MGGLHNEKVFSHRSGGWKPKIKVSAELASPEEASLLGWLMAVFSPDIHKVFPLCVSVPICVLIFSSCKDTSHIGLGFTLIEYVLPHLTLYLQ